MGSPKRNRKPSTVQTMAVEVLLRPEPREATLSRFFAAHVEAQAAQRHHLTVELLREFAQAKLEGGVSLDAWRRVLAVVGMDDRDSQFEVALAVQETKRVLDDRTEERDRLRELRDAEISNLAEACAILGIERSEWPTALEAIRILRESDRDFAKELSRLFASLRDAFGDEFDPFGDETLSQAAARLRIELDRVTADRNRLGEICDRRDLDPTSAEDEEGEVVEAEFAEPQAPEKELIADREPEASDERPHAGKPYEDSKPFSPPTPEEMKARLGVDTKAAPVRVSLGQAPKVPTLDDRMEAIRRLAEGEAKADIASALGLKNGTTVQGMTMHDKPFVERVRRAAPHDKEGVLATIRKEIERAKGASGG